MAPQICPLPKPVNCEYVRLYGKSQLINPIADRIKVASCVTLKQQDYPGVSVGPNVIAMIICM